jgi:hypothetical protein
VTTEIKQSDNVTLAEKVKHVETLESKLANMTRARDAAVAMIPYLQDRLSEAAKFLQTSHLVDISLTIRERGILVCVPDNSACDSPMVSWLEITETQTNRIIEEIETARERVRLRAKREEPHDHH